MRPGMMQRLYPYLLQQGYIQPGACVLDPFAGVALGAFHALLCGLRWVGVELEEKFVALGQQHLTYWRERYGLTGATLFQGDSRHLRHVLGQADLEGIISSPPYSGNEKSDYLITDNGGRDRDQRRGYRQGLGCFRGSETYGRQPGQLGALPPGDVGAIVSSPPFESTNIRPTALGAGHSTWADGDSAGRNKGDYHFSTSPGQLGALPSGDLGAIVSSPPYADALSGSTNLSGRDAAHARARGRNPDTPGSGYPCHYGTTPGQLGALPPGDLGAIVSSPPYEGSVHDGNGIDQAKLTGNRPGRHTQAGAEGYGTATAQLSNTTRDTFWSAASAILAESAALLPPGAIACWIVKPFVRNRALVDFPAQWQALCEHHGFTLLERIEASLVEDHGTQETLFGGGADRLSTAKKSFFRRLAERKGSPAIDAEIILIMRKETVCPPPR